LRGTPTAGEGKDKQCKSNNMGMQEVLIGYIMEPNLGYIGGREKNMLREKITNDMRKHNKSVIENLPINTDDWPDLSRFMFHQIPSGHFLNYKNSIIILGGSFKEICYLWDEWLTKFESLIGQLYWESIVITLDSEVVGEQKFVWKKKGEWWTKIIESFEKMSKVDLDEIPEWDFEGERKFFDGLDIIIKD
jgi:hypothetical protein